MVNGKNTLRALDYPFFRFVTQRPVAVTMLVLAVMVFGWISLNRLPLTLMPDISYPSVTLRTAFEGSAPEEVEQFVSRPIEQAMGVVADKISITSISRAGQSDVVVEFAWDTDMDIAIQEIREKLEMVRLPDGVDRPLILRYDPALDPVIRVGLSSRRGPGGGGRKHPHERPDLAGASGAELRGLRHLAEEVVKRDLEKLPGVAAVKVRGGLEEEIRVELDEAEMSLRSLDIQAITRQLAAENVNLAGGNLKEGRSEYVVRVLSEFRSVEEIAATRIRAGEKTWIRLSDIARVYRAGKDPLEITRVAGRPAVEIEIHKEADANVVHVAQAVRHRLFGPRGPEAALEDGRRTGEEAPSDSAAVKDQQKEKRRRGGGPGRGGRRPDWLSAELAPQGLRLSLLADQSTFIESSLRELRSTALLGGLFAVLVLFLFLRSAASTLMVALAIPLSVVATFGPMHLADLSLNIMSLGGLALGIGMLVDNSIVVLESIYRCREEGDGRIEAAVRGTGEVGQAVFASTLTTVAVFFPMVFVEGVAGQVFGDLAQVVVYALAASLVLALTFIPMLSALRSPAGRHSPAAGLSGADAEPVSAGITPEGPAARASRALRAQLFCAPRSVLKLREDLRAFIAWRRGRSSRLRRALAALAWPVAGLYLSLRLPVHLATELLLRLLILASWLLLHLARLLGAWLIRPLLGFSTRLLERGAGPFSSLAGLYPRLLGAALRHPYQVLLAAFLPLGLFIWLLLPRVGRELMPEVHQGTFHVDLTLPVGTPLERTAGRLEPLERFLMDQDEVRSVALVAGSDTQGGIDVQQGEHIARLTVRLRPHDDPRSQEEGLLRRLRPFLARLPEVESRISYPVLFSFKTPIEILIMGHDLDRLKQVTREALSRLEDLPQLADLNAGRRSGNPEVRIRYDRDALHRLGLDLQTVANLVRNKVLGSVETEFRDRERRIDVRVKLREADLKGVEAVRNLVVNPGQPVPVPLSAVAEVHLDEGPSEIRRVDQQRCSVIRANLSGGDLGSAIAGIERSLEAMDFPREYSWDVVGQSREMERSLDSLYMALLLAVFLVYVVMASQFESLLHPLVILFAVPLAFFGVIPVLLLLKIPLSVVVFLGAIMLVGIVVNNAIILVDSINLLRRKGLERLEAIRRAGQLRLRPILMTTATTVLGLLPMALGLGEGAEMRRPMALTVIVGLLSSTALTLLVVPVLYDRGERLLEVLRPSVEPDAAEALPAGGGFTGAAPAPRDPSDSG